MSFEISISKKELLRGLGKVVSFIPNSSAGKTSVVYLQASEDSLRLGLSYPDLVVSTRCSAQTTGDPETVALYGRKFFDIIKQTAHHVVLTFDGDSLTISSDNSKWIEKPIRGSAQDLQAPTEIKARVEATTLAEAFSKIQYVASTDTLQPSLYIVDVLEGKVRSSNGSNYHEVRTGEKGLTFQVANPFVDSFIKILKMWDGVVAFSESENSFYFAHGGDILSLRKVNIHFPDLDRLLIRPLKAQASFLLKVRQIDSIEALRRVRLASASDFPYVELHLNKGEALFRCLDEGSQAVSKIEAIWDNPARVLTFNTNHLYDIVTNADDEILEIRMAKDTKDRKSPIVIEGSAGSWSMLSQLKMRPRG